MKVKFIGVGSAFSRTNWNTSALVYLSDNTKPLLIDCGHTTGRALWECNIDISEIGAIAITHAHADHIGGIEEFVYYLLFVIHKGNIDDLRHNKVKLFVPAPLTGSLPVKFPLDTTTDCLLLSDAFDITRCSPNYFNYGSLSIKFIPAHHVNFLTMPSYCLQISEENKGMLYTSNTKFELALVDNRNNYNMIFHDCEFSDTPTVHATFEQLKTLPTEIKQKITLMHYTDNYHFYLDEIKEHGFKLAKQNETIII